MSPYVADQSTGESFAWATLAIILIVLLVAVLIGYFALWSPSQTTVVVPQQQPPTAVTPGPQGPPGPPGPSGAGPKEEPGSGETGKSTTPQPDSGNQGQ